ncbi:MAG: riboflavin biosynthesis protein RibF, partial [Dehalococcoidia bacterium]
MTTELAREALRHAAPQRPTAVTIGVFDGVHRGHQHLIGQMLDHARREGLASVVVTFYPHPRLVLQPQATVTYLCALEERVELLRGLGIDTVAVIPFTPRFSLTSARDFAAMLVQELGMRLLVVGPDFALGRGRQGTTSALSQLGRRMGFAVQVAPLLTNEGSKVGSSAVRTALAQGDVATVAKLLGRPFSLRGTVVRGAERGHSIGFPTANLAVGADQALPAFGVYVTRAYVGAHGHAPLRAVTNIGIRPTFGEKYPTVETHIMDY